MTEAGPSWVPAYPSFTRTVSPVNPVPPSDSDWISIVDTRPDGNAPALRIAEVIHSGFSSWGDAGMNAGTAPQANASIRDSLETRVSHPTVPAEVGQCPTVMP